MSVQLVGDDRLKIDNTRYRVLDVASEMKVLIVEGERGMTGWAVGRVSRISPSRRRRNGDRHRDGTKSDSYVAPEVVSDLELGNKVLTDYRAVILAASDRSARRRPISWRCSSSRAAG